MTRHPLAARCPVRLVPRERPLNHRLPLSLRLCPVEDAGDSVQGELAREPDLARVEAALFLADEPLTARKLATVAGLADAASARRLVARLRELYTVDGTAFQVEELAGGYQLLTRPEFHPWLTRLRRHAPETQLSPAARETLAIVAYRQPLTRADIEVIRGVGCGPVLTQLMEKGLVRLAGRDDSLGRPTLYETTRKFLQLFGLKSLQDLPPGEGLFPQQPGPTGEEPPEPEGA
jgi:segregation and condensation protein B